jgi:hypothetical protein
MARLVVTSGSMTIHGTPAGGTVTHRITAMFMSCGVFGLALLDSLGEEVAPAKRFTVCQK